MLRFEGNSHYHPPSSLREYHDKRHGAREARKLHPGDQVHVRDLDRPGVIVGNHPSPRSYLVKTEQGTVRRNNRHLAATPAERTATPRQPAAATTARATEGGETTTPPSTSSSQTVGEPARRPQRLTRAPSHLKDYVRD